MKASFSELVYVETSQPPKIRFHVSIHNETTNIVIAHGFKAEFRLFLTKRPNSVDETLYLGELHDPQQQVLRLDPKDSADMFLDYSLSPLAKNIIEKRRNGEIIFRILLRYYSESIQPNGNKFPITSQWAQVSVRYSNDIRIPSSQWANILRQAGYDRYQLIELPIDYGEILSRTKSLDGDGIQDRLRKASVQLTHILEKMNEGQWRNAVGECRIALEALTRDNVKNADGEQISAKAAISDILRKSGFPKKNVESFQMLVEQLKIFSSLQHHIKSESGEDIELPVPMDREDALFAVSSMTTILNLLASKYHKQFLR